MRFLECSALVALLGLASPAGAAGLPPDEVAKLLAGRDIYYDADGQKVAAEMKKAGLIREGGPQ
jgi:hypothetical protein